MKINALRFACMVILLGSCGGSSSAPSPEKPTERPESPVVEATDDRIKLGSISIEVPDGWKQTKPSSSMRVAEFIIGPNTELVVFHFRQGVGSVKANMDRWNGQFEQADGSSHSGNAAKTARKRARGIDIVWTDISGRYIAPIRPGATKRHDKPNHRMLAAIAQTGAGAYVFKLLGPSSVVARATNGFDAMLDSIEPTEMSAEGGW